MNLLLVVLTPFLGAGLAAYCARFGRLAPAWAAAAVTAVALALLLPSVPEAFGGGAVRIAWPWLPTLGLNLSLRLDGLGLLFALLILGIGLLIIMYARYYLSADEPMGRFYGFLLLFMGSMLGIVLSDNLLLLLLFWELTSISSFLLVGFWHHRAEARQGARMALVVTGGGGLALLGGILLLGHIAGTLEISEILRAGDLIRAHEWYAPMLTLIAVGAFAKSAQFPFHFWLPHAMAAPTPVSAYLHSATMVKAGVFLIARLYPALSGTDLWFFLIGGAGMLTLLVGAYNALFQHDIKGLLAYSTISHLGLIMLLFGMGTELSAAAGVFHIINHAIFKASLFMAAGIIDHETGCRDMRRINGLWKYMPHTAMLAMVAAAAMAGVPLLNGFLSKEMFFAESLIHHLPGGWNWTLPTVAVIAGVFSVAYSLRFIHDVFFNGEPIDLPRRPREPPRYMRIPVEILAVLCLLVGIFPAVTVLPILTAATAAVLHDPARIPVFDLAVWHGFTAPFVMSLIALTGGVIVYTLRRWVFELHDNLPHLSAKGVFDAGVRGLVSGCRHITRATENGSLQRYVAVFVVTALVLGAAPFVTGRGGMPVERITTGIDPISIAVALVLMVAAIAIAVLHRQRLVALVLLGVVGLVIALAFTRFSAPDLALTQLSVEVVSIILLLLALYFLPGATPRRSGGFDARSGAGRRLRDAGVAGLAGAGVGAVCWALLTRPHDSISGYFLEQAVPGGGGHNVVNVILVDFRGFDTLGEITVLAIAAIGIHAMLQGLRLVQPAADIEGRPWAGDRHPVILATLSRPLLPLALLVSIYLLLRGHNMPGGGFIAGLVAGVALILQYLASGIAWTRERIRFDYFPVTAAGVIVATVTGMASWIFGRPFLTSAFGHFDVPAIGHVELASAIMFDLGVFLTVVGAVMLILARLGELTAPDEVPRPVTEPTP